MEYNKTFAMIKPGAVHRGLIGEIIKRIEIKGLNIVAMKMIWVNKDQAHAHYVEHLDKPFFDDLIACITSAPAIVLAIEGEEAVALVRNMAGSTNPLKSEPGTVRGDFSSDLENNIIHTADSVLSAKRELEIYFSKEEYLDYKRITNKWSFEFKK